jgi:hypothetical protein
MSAFLIGFIAGCIAAVVILHYMSGGGDTL